jgi:hypothetical protein
MIFSIIHKNGDKLFTGTKNDCMHYIKCRKLDKTLISIKAFPVKLNTVEEEVYSTTSIPDQKSPSFFKRMFTKHE